jgi:membrane-bound lytic murein transglycosylase A
MKNFLILLVLGTQFVFADEVLEDKPSLTPAMELVEHEIVFSDDLHLEHMLQAIGRQEKYFSVTNLEKKSTFGKRRIKRSHLKQSLSTFKKYVVETINCFQIKTSQECYQVFNENINRDFEAYKPLPLKWEKGFNEKKTLFTAYYSPDFLGSRVKTDRFKNPIYAMPKDLKLLRATSDEINYGKVLDGKSLELFYVEESLYDIWLLHVEGGGRVKVAELDGSFKHYYLSYAGSNKREFNMLYKYMIDAGMLTTGATSIKKQREYFISHPENQRKILKSCASYIWFKVTEDEPLGVGNIPLTVQRSLATDYRRMHEYGVINFIKYNKTKTLDGEEIADEKKVSFSRFFLNQDTGGAIKGNARSDLYFGFGKNGETAANNIYGLGEQYFLILK